METQEFSLKLQEFNTRLQAVTTDMLKLYGELSKATLTATQAEKIKVSTLHHGLNNAYELIVKAQEHLKLATA